MVPHLQVKGKSRAQSIRTAATERIKKVSILQRAIGDKLMYDCICVILVFMLLTMFKV